MLWLLWACETEPTAGNPHDSGEGDDSAGETGAADTSGDTSPDTSADSGGDTSGDTSSDSGGDTSGDSGEDTGVSELRPRFGAAVPAETATAVWSASVGQFGQSLATPDDVDGDGISELLVGNPQAGTIDLVGLTTITWAALGAGGDLYGWNGHSLVGGTDSVWMVGPGATSGELDTIYAARLAGEGFRGGQVATGDLNGDGLADAVVGSEGTNDFAGIVWLFLDPQGDVDATSADRIWNGDAMDDRLGSGLAFSADNNGDGYAELVVGADADEAGPPGTVYLRDADTTFATLVGEAADDVLGHSVSAGDVDGDGFTDLVLGAYENDEGGYNAGAVYVVYGPVSGSVTVTDTDHAKRTGVSGEIHASEALNAIPDLDGDGTDEVLVGGHVQGGTGLAWLLYGPVNSGALAAADTVFTHTAVDAQLGWDVCGPGDMDGDGFMEVAISARGVAPAGEVRVFSAK